MGLRLTSRKPQQIVAIAQAPTGLRRWRNDKHCVAGLRVLASCALGRRLAIGGEAA